MNDKEKQLWKEYRKTKDIKIRDTFILQYLPIVKYTANIIIAKLPKNIELGDLISYGIFGLIDAIEKFDILRSTNFKNYAIIRIRGTIYDELRKLDWVPRIIRNKIKDVETAKTKLEKELNRTPTTMEIINECKINTTSYNKLYNYNNQNTIDSLDYKYNRTLSKLETIQLQDSNTPDNVYEQKEIKKLIKVSLDNLLNNSKKVLILYYYENLSLTDIGSILNLSASRISQIHLKALKHLKFILLNK